MDLKLRNNSQLALTDGYIPVEYVESSNSPNINTGIIINWSTRLHKIDAIIDVIENTSANSNIWYATKSNRVHSLQCSDANDNTNFLVRSYAGSATSPTPTSVEFIGKTHIIVSANYLEINGNNISIGAAQSASVSDYLYLLSGTSKVRIYSFKIYSSSTLVRDFIPVISCQEGHFGEACLYDKANEVFYYSTSTGSFTASTTIYDRITTAFVKDCPNISGIDLLRIAVNLQRVRCNIGDVSGTLEELQHYATLSGYSDNYEEQTKPRIVGNFTINTYHSNEEKNSIDIDGLVLFSDNNYNVDYLLDNNLIAVQTVDENEEGYNQPIADVLISNNLAHSLSSDNTKIFMTKTEAAAITSLPVDLFRSNTDIESFDEFKYWTGLTTITAGSSTSALGAFGGCTSLESIIIPNNITTIGAYAFYGCEGLTTCTIPSSVTSIGSYAFYGCSGLTGNLTISDNVTSISGNAFALTNFTSAKLPKELPITHNPISIFAGNNTIKDITIGSTVSINIGNGTSPCGDGTGTLTVYSDTYTSRNNYTGRFKNYIIHGSHTTERSGLWNNTINNIPYSFRVKNKIGSTLSSAFLSYVGNSPYNASTLSFVECGNIEAPNVGCIFMSDSTRSRASNCILHINRNTLPTNYAANAPYYKVGLGLSRAEDEATLALYLADSTWSAQSAKLGTWYDYNGEYKWYYITDNLTNCTNTNPDAWPHITRGESYETTIIPDEGMTINSLTVEMLDTDTTSPTYDTLVDITSSVYDSSTGEINIPSVTGNVVITASAS